MTTYIRRKYFVATARQTAKRAINRVLICSKFYLLAAKQLMGKIQAFDYFLQNPLTGGVYFSGPIDISQRNLRNKKINKAIICIFLSMVTNAVH